MNDNSFPQFGHSFHTANNAASETAGLFSFGEPGAAAPLFTSANTGLQSEATQQMRWQLPDERRLHVVRGGLRRDWRTGGQVMSGLFLIGLLTLALAHWPVHAPTQVTPHSTPTVALPTSSSLAVPYAIPTERQWAFSAYRSGFSNYTNTADGSAYRHLRLPVPGLPDAYVSRSARPGRANALHDGYYAVPPAAPTGLGPSVPRYSY